jgi:RNA polymerase sigma factor (sigma-70 family)
MAAATQLDFLSFLFEPPTDMPPAQVRVRRYKRPAQAVKYVAPVVQATPPPTLKGKYAQHRSLTPLEVTHDDIKSRRQYTEEEQVALSGLARKGDTHAQEELAGCHYPLAWSRAEAYCESGNYELTDVIGPAMLGVFKAAKKWDPTVGTFAKLAVYYIQKELGLATHTLDQATSGPIARTQKVRRVLRHFANSPEAEKQSDATIAKALKVSPGFVKEAREVQHHGWKTYADTPMGDSGLTIGESIAADPETYEERLEAQDTHKREVDARYQQLLALLPDDDRDIITRAYGVGGSPKARTRTLALKYGGTVKEMETRIQAIVKRLSQEKRYAGQ